MPPSLPSDATGTSVGCHSGARKLPSDASAVGAAESDFRRMPLVQVVEKWARGGRTSVGCHSLPSDASGQGCEQAVTDGAPPRDCLARPWGRAEVRWLSWDCGGGDRAAAGGLERVAATRVRLAARRGQGWSWSSADQWHPAEVRRKVLWGRAGWKAFCATGAWWRGVRARRGYRPHASRQRPARLGRPPRGW